MDEQRYIIEEDAIEAVVRGVRPAVREIVGSTHRLYLYDLTSDGDHLSDLYLPPAMPLDDATIIALARAVVGVHRAGHAQGYHLGRRALQAELQVLVGVRP